MYKIEKKNYGVKLVFSGVITQEEMVKWVTESASIIKTLPAKFGVFVDMRELKTLSQESKSEMEKGQILYKTKGMERSVVILESAVTMMQFKKIAKETGIYEWERYIDASAVKDWEEKGKKWLVSAIDPDK